MAIRRLEREREGERERFPSTKPRYYTPRYWMKELATGIAKSFRNVFLRCRRFFFSFFSGDLSFWEGERERERERRVYRGKSVSKYRVTAIRARAFELPVTNDPPVGSLSRVYRVFALHFRANT